MYNPFEKALDELDEGDLATLISRKVAEGYYIEFKTIPPSKAKIGHSVASFANTHGGWYIIGVTTDENNVAVAVNGFPRSDLDDPISTIRDVIKTHIDPVPLFFIRVVELNAGTIVVVVQVPDNQEAPFITRDGRLYRRKGDSSAPIAESDRHSLDRLYDETRKARERFATFAQDERTFAKGESQQGWAKLFFSPYPYGSVDKGNLTAPSKIADLIEQTRMSRPLDIASHLTITGNLPLESAYPTPQSVVMQRRQTDNIAYNSLTVELFCNGRARIFIPFTYQPTLEVGNFADVQSDITRRALQQIFLDSDKSAVSLVQFVDIGALWLQVCLLVSWYLDWIGSEPQIEAIDFALRVDGAWRCIAFCDIDEWGTHVVKFGAPVLRMDAIRYPSIDGESLRLKLDEERHSLWLTIGSLVGLALGMPGELSARIFVHALFAAAQQSQAQ